MCIMLQIIVEHRDPHTPLEHTPTNHFGKAETKKKTIARRFFPMENPGVDFPEVV